MFYNETLSPLSCRHIYLRNKFFIFFSFFGIRNKWFEIFPLSENWISKDDFNIYLNFMRQVFLYFPVCVSVRSPCTKGICHDALLPLAEQRFPRYTSKFWALTQSMHMQTHLPNNNFPRTINNIPCFHPVKQQQKKLLFCYLTMTEQWRGPTVLSVDSLTKAI